MIHTCCAKYTNICHLTDFSIGFKNTFAPFWVALLPSLLLILPDFDANGGCCWPVGGKWCCCWWCSERDRLLRLHITVLNTCSHRCVLRSLRSFSRSELGCESNEHLSGWHSEGLAIEFLNEGLQDELRLSWCAENGMDVLEVDCAGPNLSLLRNIWGLREGLTLRVLILLTPENPPCKGEEVVVLELTSFPQDVEEEKFSWLIHHDKDLRPLSSASSCKFAQVFSKVSIPYQVPNLWWSLEWESLPSLLPSL